MKILNTTLILALIAISSLLSAQPKNTHSKHSTLDIRLQKLPKNKGMFVQALTKAESTPERFGKRAKDNDIQWIAIQGVSVREGQYAKTRITTSYIDAFRKAVPGGKVYLWGWACANRSVDRYTDILFRNVDLVDADGVILDIEGKLKSAGPESSWKDGYSFGKRTEIMKNLMDKVIEEAKQRNIVVGVSSLGTATRGFPWSEMKRADFGVPQLYSPYNHIFRTSNGRVTVRSDKADYVKTGVEKWKSKGINYIVVALATDTHRKKSDHHVKALNDIAITPNGAVCWWRWRRSGSERTSSMTSRKWNLIKNFKLKKQ